MRTIAFDLSAMFVGAGNDTPRGIDRVDMGYAKRVFADAGSQNLGLLPSVGRMGAMTSAEARDFAALTERRWQEAAAPADDAALSAWLRRSLAGERGVRPPRRRGRPGAAQMTLRYAGLALRARRTTLHPATAAVPRGALYVNTGQVLLRYAWFFDWLDRRPDVKPVFMMHDLIPILYPEYCGPDMALHHERSVDTLARRAAAMIATSESSAADIRTALKKRGRSDIPIHVTRLPVDNAFFVRNDVRPFRSAPAYFVAVGAIDQRKNHLLLLNVWREIARCAKAPPPKLVIVGVRGRRSDGVIDLLGRCPGLIETVIETNGLSTPAMRELMRDARALLMPSFTEGYGLPVVEALALGAPVIASDIPAHREVGGSFATYLDPTDGPAWAAEIIARSEETMERTQERRECLRAYRPQTWDSYFEQVLPFINSL
jgi:glycosyltransferase involved in cell wall biosynthesis